MSQPAQTPVIETERTLLRAHRLEDFHAYQAMWADPVVTRFIGGRPRTREEWWVRFLRHAGSWSMLGYGYWAIEEKATGGFVGEAGFHDMKRDIEPSIEGVPEAGWVLAPAFQGQGLATEVVRGFHDWATGRPGFARTVCIINPGNIASLAVAAKLGYREKARSTYHDVPTVVLER